jgi:protein TIF31
MRSLEAKSHELVASVETKGLLGTDGRKYVLDLYRITPLDIDFIEKYWKGVEGVAEGGYPHRMAVLRPELVEAFWKVKMREYVSAELEKRKKAKEEATAVEGAAKEEVKEEAKEEPTEEAAKEEAKKKTPAEGEVSDQNARDDQDKG